MLSLDKQNAYRQRYKRLHPAWRTSGEVYESLVRQYVSPEARVLDLGCGRGGVVELFHDKVALAAGLDADMASLREHRALTRLVVGLAGALPFAEATFDLITCSWVLEHLQRPEAAFAQIVRVLRPGGHFVFLTPNAHNSLTLANRILRGKWQGKLVERLYGRVEADTFPVVYRANTLQRLESLASTVGLARVTLYTVGDPTYIAFNDALFALGALLERLTPPTWKVHLVGDYARGLGG
ncbi:MAG: class I SAM-dependent methyltransferase [Anaerolineae bacterium]